MKKFTNVTTPFCSTVLLSANANTSPPKGEKARCIKAQGVKFCRTFSPFGGDVLAFAESKTVEQKGVVARNIHLLKFFILSFFLSSCGPNYILNEEKKMENQQWTYADSLVTTVDISDTKKMFSLYLDVEHLTEYGYQNMYVRLHSIFPDGKRVTENISVELMDKIGRWKGDCNSDDCDFRMPIHEGTNFGQTGKHTFVIEQFMRKNPLEGIQSIAFRIEDTGKYLEAK